MSVEKTFAAATVRSRRGGSRVFFGESATGIKYEWPGAFPPTSTEDDFVPAAGSDDGSDCSDGVHHEINKLKPKFVDHYVLGPKIGEGAYAKVLEGMDDRTLRIVAVKVIEKRHVSKIKDGMEDIKREMAIMKAIKKHPNVIELIDVIGDEDSPKIYLMMELANGCSLQELMEKAPEQRIPEFQAKFFFRQMMLGLQYLHGKNIVHRDIKPANLMLTTEFELKISDFGVAEFLDKYNASDLVTRTKGSPAFYAPEITKGDSSFSGMAVDVWAAGVTLFYLLVGKVPFDAEHLMVLFKQISSGEFDLPDFLDADAKDLIQQMLTVEASKRITVHDVLRHPWAQEFSVKGATKDFIPVEMREIQLIKMLATLYDDELETSTASELSTAASSRQEPPFMQFFHELTKNFGDIRCSIM